MSNHDSGGLVSTRCDPNPSPRDVQFTREAGRAGDLLDIPVLDHVILGRRGFVSLRRQGLYAPPAASGDPIAADQ